MPIIKGAFKIAEKLAKEFMKPGSDTKKIMKKL